ncbi:MAG: DUF1826 domain-containing protein [Pseudomonadota bacterium]
MMTAILESIARQSTSPDVLDDILYADTNLAIWERSPIPEVDALLEGAGADVRFSASLIQIDDRLRLELSHAGFPDHPAKYALIEDIADLAKRFGSILGLEQVELRLERVTTNSCRKFHADYVSARLITTYVGTGTNWLDTQDAQRVARGEEPARIHSLNTGDVGMFKGKLSTDFPVIHRSPPIDGTGETRLLLVLNPPSSGRSTRL